MTGLVAAIPAKIAESAVFSGKTRGEQKQILLSHERAEEVLATPSPALTTTRKDRAMADCFSIPESTAAKGTQGEMIAAAWLIGLGYDVLKNISHFGPVDLVALDPKRLDVCLIDVKTTCEENIFERRDGSLALPFSKKGHPGVHRLFVCAGRVIGFFRRAESGFDGHHGRPLEQYWPLSCDPCDFEISAKGRTYKEAVLARRGSGAWK